MSSALTRGTHVRNHDNSFESSDQEDEGSYESIITKDFEIGSDSNGSQIVDIKWTSDVHNYPDDAPHETLDDVFPDQRYRNQRIMFDNHDDSNIESINMIMANAATHESSSNLRVFTGSKNGQSFSMWLRHFEDLMRLKEPAPNGAKKAAYLIAYTDGQARDRLDELSDAERKDYSQVVEKLTQCFEGKQKKFLARQELIQCRQRRNESVADFAHRLSNLVKSCSDNPSSDSTKKRMKDEFIDRLQPNIRYHTKLVETTSFESALNRAETIEMLLSEANVEKEYGPINPFDGRELF